MHTVGLPLHCCFKEEEEDATTRRKVTVDIFIVATVRRQTRGEFWTMRRRRSKQGRRYHRTHFSVMFRFKRHGIQSFHLLHATPHSSVLHLFAVAVVVCCLLIFPSSFYTWHIFIWYLVSESRGILLPEKNAMLPNYIVVVIVTEIRLSLFQPPQSSILSRRRGGGLWYRLPRYRVIWAEVEVQVLAGDQPCMWCDRSRSNPMQTKRSGWLHWCCRWRRFHERSTSMNIAFIAYRVAP